ncbi:MAG: hypothetical protein KDC83_08785 [Flavobacteriales bacterium]|nr:hypothetical protein [Flavobacteriales bacterium]
MPKTKIIEITKAPRFIFLGLFWLTMLASLHGISQESKKIEILQADDFYYDEIGGVKAKRLIGNVKIKHENTLMYCDSAYVYNATNDMSAFGHVHITDPEDMDLWGDSLKYYGTKKITEVRGSVKMVNEDMTLTTRFLNFDRSANHAWYWNGGLILMNDGKDSLWSRKGDYYSSLSEMRFKDSVVLKTADYEINTDTMHYHTKKERSYFFGPTHIISDSNHIYTEKGWSDNKTGLSEFTLNSYIFTAEQQLWGDSILYDQKKNIGEMFFNVTLLDTVNEFMVQGDYVLHNQEDSTSLVLGKPILTQFFDTDSMVLHADTLFSHFDSSRQFRIMHAYPKAQFFKSDMQGKCDSLIFSDLDSSIHMYDDPVLWSEANQITSDFIQVFRSNGELERMTMNNNAFIISLEDSIGQYKKYNQIKGDSMVGFFTNGELSKVNVNHNGNTIYFAKEEEKDSSQVREYLGMNKADCQNMTIYLDSNEVTSIVFRVKPTATLYPLKDVTPRMMFLKDFSWRDSERPKRKEDIFNWKEEEEVQKGE